MSPSKIARVINPNAMNINLALPSLAYAATEI
jgi:hypothetical protein